MDSQLWLVAIKGDESPALLESKTKDLCAHMGKFPVPVPGLRVGTLDSLMSLSDDLVKMDSVAESTTFKLLKQLTDLKPREQPTVSGVPLYNYATSLWEWDEAKFQLKTPLRELSESIAARLGGMDDELKTKLAELNVLKGAVAQAERKQQGNLMVRGLADLVKEGDVIESDSMTTLLVVVPKSSDKEFLAGYMGMARFVVPHSAKQIAADPELALFAVVVLKKCVDEFRHSAREKRYTIRDFTYTASKKAEDATQRRNDEAEADRLKGLLANWLQINFAEAYSMMMHLKAIRIFTESVLRYGLAQTASGVGPHFHAFLMHPKRGKADALRKVMGSLYSVPGGMIADEEVVVPGVGPGEFYPYVYVTLDLEAPNL